MKSLSGKCAANPWHCHNNSLSNNYAFTSRFVLLEEEVNKVFEEDGLSWQGFSALQGLKQFMYSGTDGIPLAIVSLASYTPSFVDLLI